MLHVLLIAAAVAQADETPSERILGWGLAFEAGKQAIHGEAWVPAADWRTIEARVYLTERTSVDFSVDWIRMVLSRLLTSAPALPSSACLHLRAPTGGGWALAAAPGIDTTIGVASIVHDEQLAWRPTIALYPSAKLGFEHGSKGSHYDFGLFLRGTTGASLGPYGSDRYARLVLQLTFTWNILGDA